MTAALMRAPVSPIDYISTTVGPHENPRVDRSYPRWRQMQADMERYYNQCKKSPKARRLRGSAGSEYCSRTAWMILRKAGRYSDYPAFRRPAHHTPYVARPGRRAAEMAVYSNENPLYENPMSTGAKVAIGVGVAAALGLGAYFLFFNKPAAAATPPAPSVYNSATAISAPLGAPGTALKVSVGSSITAQNGGQLWLTPGVTTSDATVLAPSVPSSTNGFVAIKAGTATLTGSYIDPNTQQTVTATITITAS